MLELIFDIKREDSSLSINYITCIQISLIVDKKKIMTFDDSYTKLPNLV